MPFVRAEPPTQVPVLATNCVICGRPLTNPQSRLARVGSTCIKAYGPRPAWQANPDHDRWVGEWSHARATQAHEQARLDLEFQRLTAAYPVVLEAWERELASPGGLRRRAQRREATGRLLPALVATVVALVVVASDPGPADEQNAAAVGEAAMPAQAAQGDASPGATPSPMASMPERPRLPAMPDVVGMPFPDAQTTVHALRVPAGGDQERLDRPQVVDLDLSPRDRSVYVPENWTVAATVPAAGEPVTSSGVVWLFLLKNEEWTWLVENPTMPALPADAASLDLTREGGPLAGMRELVELRYAPGHEPEHRSPARPPVTGEDRTPDLSDSLDPSFEPVSEREARDALLRAYSGLVIASLPGVGEPVRPGALITVLVREEPYVPAEPLELGDADVDGGEDDGDFDVPDRLCPTRFC